MKTIYTITHKNFTPPKDSIYKTLVVGGKVELNDSEMDSTGENISELNNELCELTGLYWIWKNRLEENEVVGLCHYRRYFINEMEKGIITKENVDKLFEDFDIVLPKKRNYLITNIENHYKVSHKDKDLNLLKEIIERDYKEYIFALRNVLN
ncbi:DUF4422 domain-containing protein, partial [Rosenbergiella metrosideri]|uniref:DUF4422 domain-containing protein n=1 Tax=Rosenbergiella metrosideri TaxID=2921185 RepID=UPI001F4F9BE0